MSLEFIPYGRQMLTNDDEQAVLNVLMSNFWTQGPAIKEFEDALAEFTGAKYVVAVNSGTAALHCIYKGLGLTEGDEFITTPITFAATANAGRYLGANPIFVDIDPNTGNIDVTKIEAAITPKTKLISVVHYAGQSVDMQTVHEIATRHNLKVVEDACHAIGGSYNGKKVGNGEFSNAVSFSFHPVKHVASGEGGAVLTNSEEIYKAALKFRTHGITKEDFEYPSHGAWYYEMQELGYNYRITDLQAALGSSQLKRINWSVERRNEIAEFYNKAFANNPYFEVTATQTNGVHAYHLYPILLKPEYRAKKADFVDALHQLKLGVQCHYIPVYELPYYRKSGYEALELPNASDFYRSEISIPMYPTLSNEQLADVVVRIEQACNQVFK